jgi:hypothetical protein
MALGRRVMTLFGRRRVTGSSDSRTPSPSDAGAPRHAVASRAGSGRQVSESTLEAMFAYQDELSRTFPRQRRGAGRAS